MENTEKRKRRNTDTTAIILTVVLLASIILPSVMMGIVLKEMNDLEKAAIEYAKQQEEFAKSLSPNITVNIPTTTTLDKTKKLVENVETDIQDDIDPYEHELLAHLIYAEAGSDWCSDNMQMYVGSVVLNRMASDLYPDSMYDVIYQEGQYGCVENGHIEYDYNQRAWNTAQDLLTSGSILPANVIFQAQFPQGDGTYIKEQNMYFCYTNQIEVGEE